MFNLIVYFACLVGTVSAGALETVRYHVQPLKPIHEHYNPHAMYDENGKEYPYDFLKE
jgi:hypothetical protein